MISRRFKRTVQGVGYLGVGPYKTSKGGKDATKKKMSNTKRKAFAAVLEERARGNKQIGE